MTGMPNIPTEQQLRDCKHCNGTGKVVIPPTSAFAVGDKVWWKAARTLWYYGYQDHPVPAEVLSITKYRVFIRFQDVRHNSPVSVYVEPRFLEPRNE
jgi:hypothetical protein